MPGTAQVAVVTGAASGFGLAVAHELAVRGWAVALFDLDGPRVDDAAHAVAAAHGAETLARCVDVASEAQLAEAAAAVSERFGRCDLLWANVGVQHFGTVESSPAEVWRWVLDVNVVGAVATVQAFLPLLRQAGGGRLAFTASANALAPAARLGVYQASKYALVGVAETLRFELAADGIDVSVVYPAGMITRHLESSAAARPAELGPGEVAEADLLAMMDSRPMGEADLTTAEIAAAAAVDGVLDGAPHVLTHGDLAAAIAEHERSLDDALARLASRSTA